MIELLKLCGFEAQDIESELPRVEKAFNRLGITGDDIERGKRRLAKYYDTELEGVRKALRLCVLEMVNSVLAREEGKKKIIFGFNAPGFDAIATALVSNSQEVYSAHHSWSFQLLIGCIFDKMVPVFEAAERKWLKAGAVAHCGNIKTLLGLLELNFIPRPDLMVTSGFLCEAAPKTVDLLRELYSMPVFCCDTCQDRELKEYSEATRRSVDLAARSLRKLVERVQEVVGFEITDEMLWEVINAKKKSAYAMRKLRDIIENSDPLPINATHETIWMSLRMLTLSIERLPEAIDAIDTVCKELQERVDKGLGAVEKGAPRIIATLPTHHTDPRLEHLAGELGIAIVATDPRFIVPDTPVSKNPYGVISQSFQMSIFTTLSRRIPLLIEGCKILKVDGVLDRYHAGCRTYVGDAVMIKDAVEKELGIPVLLLEWENFDPRVYNHEQYKRRLEVFKSMMVKRPG